MKRYSDKGYAWRAHFFIALAVMGGVLTSASAWGQQVQGSGDITLGVSATRDPANQFTLDGGFSWQDAYILNSPNAAYATPLSGTRYISEDATGLGHIDTTRHYRTVIWPCACHGRRVPALTSFKVHADNVAELQVTGTFKGKQIVAEVAANFQDPPEDLITAPPIGVPGAVILKPGPNVLDIYLQNFMTPTALDYKAKIECIRRTHVKDERDDD